MGPLGVKPALVAVKTPHKLVRRREARPAASGRIFFVASTLED
jgi:hypothetical protein